MSGAQSLGHLCRTCRAPITWAISRNGKRIPLDRDPSPAGTIALEHGTATPIAHVVGTSATEPRYVSHFVTCPDASTHRRSR